MDTWKLQFADAICPQEAPRSCLFKIIDLLRVKKV